MSQDSGERINQHFYCIANEFEHKESCNSSDAMSVYQQEDESGNITYNSYCWSCGQGFSSKDFHSSSLAEEFGIQDGGVVSERKNFTFAKKPDPLTKEEINHLKQTVGFTDKPYRCLDPEWLMFFGHMVKRNSKGVATEIYYPETEDNKVCGFKIRITPKFFTKVGRTGKSSQLSGQFRYKSPSKRVAYVGGENDKVALWGTLRKYDVHVVSPTTGEGSAASQAAAQYEFFDGYDEIYVGMDADSAGDKATEEICKVLPADKVKIIKWAENDPHRMLENGNEKHIIRNFFNAKNYVDSGIKSSNQILGDVKDVLLAEKITLPSYMCEMERMMKRAFTKTGRCINIIGPTSCGKSTHVNNMIYHWIFSEGLKPLIISLEMTSGEYAIDLLSLHLKKNLDWFKEGMDAWDYLQREDVKLLYDDLFCDDEYNERFCIVDDRDGTIESIKKLIDRGVKQYGCNIVIIDVLSDILRFLPMDEQEKFMSWEKNYAKGEVNMINVLHTRKLDRDKEGNMRHATEYDALGSSTFVQSAHINIIINRDKMTDCPIEKNTTHVDMSKCRRGTTGDAGKWYYDVESRQSYDFDTYFSGRKTNPEYNADEFKDNDSVNMDDASTCNKDGVVESNF